MNKNINDAIQDSISNQKISINLLLLCLAAVNNKIIFSKQNISGYGYELQRDAFAKILLNNGMSKEILSDKIQTISKHDYPSFKQIKRIYDIISNGNFVITNNIPDRWIHYKTEQELQLDKERKLDIEKKKNADNEKLIELCQFVERNILYYTDGIIHLSKNQRSILERLRSPVFSYDVILQCFKEYSRDIKKALAEKEFRDEQHRFQYICGIIRNHLPDIIKKKMQRQKSEEGFLKMDLKCVTYTGGATYQRKTKDIPIKKAFDFEEMW